MNSTITPNERLRHLQDYNQRLIRDQKRHTTRRSCQDSKWPYTGDLRPEEIVCMRDSYCGKRHLPSCLQPLSRYDSIYHLKPGWNQWMNKDARQIRNDSQFASKDEDKHRKVVVFGNSTYGHYIDRFIDFTYRDHARYHICKHQFSTSGPISTLPPAMGLNSKL